MAGKIFPKTIGDDYDVAMNIEKAEKYKIKQASENTQRDRVIDISKSIILPGYYLSILNLFISIILEKKSPEKEKKEFRFNLINKFSNKVGVTLQSFRLRDRIVYKKIPIFLLPDSINYIEEKTNPRKVIYPSEKVSKSIRHIHTSHKFILDFLETPESEKIGLTLSLVDSQSLDYNFDSLNFKNSSTSHNAENFLSFATSQIPFLLNSDAVRILMGSKNLKQAIKVVDAEQPIIKTNKEIDSIGVNGFVGYGLFEGFNFEDGIVVSKSFANKMKIKVMEKKKYFISLDSAVNSFKENKEEKNYWLYTLRKNKNNINEIAIKWHVQIDDYVGYGDILYTVYKDSKLFYKKYYTNRYTAKIINIPDIPVPYFNNIDFSKQSYLVDFYIEFEVTKPLEVGDKIMGRHGNKGTVSRIIPENEMPVVYFNNKEKPLDVILSPLGVVSRMNLGQLYEVHYSMAQIFSNFNLYENGISPFESGYKNNKKLLNSLKNIGSDEYGRFKVLYNKNEWNLTVGFQYFVRLDHHSRNKLHFVNKADESALSKQPYKGKKHNGGQKFGEMEFWSLFSYNNINLINLFSNKNTQKKQNESSLDIFKELLNEIGFDLNTTESSSKFVSIEPKNSEIFELFGVKNTFKNEIIEYFKNNKKSYSVNILKKLLFKKDGYIRSYLTSKRLHNSGRAVITPQPKDNMKYYTNQDINLSINNTILPIEMGIEFLKNDKEYLNLSKNTISLALKGDYKKRLEVARALNEFFVKSTKMVILNRQPSLHRHSMQSFYPLFWTNYTIGLPIYVCEGFNADFDGDTMAVYYPAIQNEIIKKELEKMLPLYNPFKLGDGSLIYSIDQDVVYGYYIKTKKNKKTLKNEIKKQLYKSVLNKDYKKIESIFDSLNEYLQLATEKNLTLSIYEIIKNKDKNSMTYIRESNCRGKDKQYNQLYNKIENISENNFYKGIPFDDYFKEKGLAYRARKTLMDKKLGVADAGYFTRKLVEFLSNIIVDDFNEFESTFIDLSSIKNDKDENLFSINDFLNRYIVVNNKELLLTIDNINDFKNLTSFILLSPKIKEVSKNKFIISKKYLGRDLSSLNEVERFIGITAGHVIGERGTQLSMETFHTGSNGLNMITISSEIFKSAFSELDFKSFLKRISTIEGINILEKINVNPVYFEILYYFAKELNKNYDISSAKKYFKDFNLRGPLSTMSFEDGLRTLKNIELNKEYKESSFRFHYAFGGKLYD